MKVQIFSEDGKAIEDTGQAGELVCTAVFPSQPAYFWNNRRGARYKAAYYDQFEGMRTHFYLTTTRLNSCFMAGIWTQGDFIRMNPQTRGHSLFKSK